MWFLFLRKLTWDQTTRIKLLRGPSKGEFYYLNNNGKLLFRYWKSCAGNYQNILQHGRSIKFFLALFLCVSIVTRFRLGKYLTIVPWHLKEITMKLSNGFSSIETKKQKMCQYDLELLKNVILSTSALLKTFSIVFSYSIYPFLFKKIIS